MPLQTASQVQPYPTQYNRVLNRSRTNSTTNIVFIKLHKVGGSTLRSVLTRYAREYGLHVAGSSASMTSHIFAEHKPLPDYLRRPLVPDPIFITLLRSPLEHACSYFYWNWHDQRFRRDTPGNFSRRHLRFLAVFSRQNGTRISFIDRRPFPKVHHQPGTKAAAPGAKGARDNRTTVDLVYKRQWEWFADSPAAALRQLAALNFSLGFSEASPPPSSPSLLP